MVNYIDALENRRSENHSFTSIILQKSLLFFLGLLAIIDSINGIILDYGFALNIGQVFRLIFFVILLTYLLQHFSFFEAKLVISIFIISISLQMLFYFKHSNTGWLINDFTELAKVLTIMFIVTCLRIEFKINKFMTWLLYKNIIKMNSYLFPLMLFIPKIFGYGESVYSNGAGFKGWFYANNDLSIILAALLWFNIIMLTNSFKIPFSFNKFDVSVRILLLTGASFLIGAKSLYILVIAAFIFLFMFYIMKFNFLKIFFISFFVFLVYGVLWRLYSEKIMDYVNLFLERQLYFLNTRSDGSISGLFVFLTTDRVLFVEEVFSEFYAKTINFPSEVFMILIGYGKNYYINSYRLTEMDFVDLIFSYGMIFTLILYAVLYIPLFDKNSIRIGYSFVIVSGIILFFSTFGGHVFFSGMAGSIFALFTAPLGFKEVSINQSVT